MLATAVWNTATQTLTLTLDDGTNIPVALSGLETQAEVATAIAAALANRLVRSDIIAGTNISLTNGTGNQVTIAASGTETFTGLTDTPSSIVADDCGKGKQRRGRALVRVLRVRRGRHRDGGREGHRVHRHGQRPGAHLHGRAE